MSCLYFYLDIRRRFELQQRKNVSSRTYRRLPVSLERSSGENRPSQQQPEENTEEELPFKVTVILKKSLRMLTTGFSFPAQTQDEDPGVIQVDVAFLSYLDEGEHNGNARLDSISYVTMRELIAHEVSKKKKKLEMGKNAYKHFKWYIRALKEELAAQGPERKFKIVHWLISSRNVAAFMIKSEFFPAISIIIAPKQEHWYAAYATEDGRSKYGTRNRHPNLSGAPGTGDPPTYIRCREDYCANNCVNCQKAKNCICFLRKRFTVVAAISEEQEEDLGDLV